MSRERLSESGFEGVEPQNSDGPEPGQSMDGPGHRLAMVARRFAGLCFDRDFVRRLGRLIGELHPKHNHGGSMVCMCESCSVYRNSLETMIENLRGSLERVIAERQVEKQKVAEFHREVIRLNGMVNGLTDQRDKAREIAVDLNRRINERHQENEDLRARVGNQTDESENLIAERELITQRAIELSRKVARLTDQLDRARVHSIERCHEILKLAEENEDLRAQIGNTSDESENLLAEANNRADTAERVLAAFKHRAKKMLKHWVTSNQISDWLRRDIEKFLLSMNTKDSDPISEGINESIREQIKE